jgi:hypothetical protein
MRVAGRAHKEQGSEHKKPAPSSLRIASAAHELKNPLQTIADLVYLLQQNPHMEGQAHEHLNQIEKELEHVRHIINQTLGRYREPASPTILDKRELAKTISLNQCCCLSAARPRAVRAAETPCAPLRSTRRRLLPARSGS